MTQSELLDRLESDLSDLLSKLRTQFATRPAEALLVRPLAGKWNAAECFAHLNVYFDYYLPRIELALHKAKARGWAPDYERKQNWLGRRAIRNADPAYMDERPRHSPKQFNPSKLLKIRENELKRLLINVEMTLRLVRQAREVDLNKAKVKPLSAWVGQFLLGDLLEYLTLHTQRHVLQAERNLAFA
jgi:hypothetical protein